MAVVDVRIVVMFVGYGFMDMPVSVRRRGILVGGIMFMHMVGPVSVAMAVSNPFVGMVVKMFFGEVEPYSDAH